jgi:hypothetical protein
MDRTVVPAQPEFAKYIILTWNGREQVLVFPFNVKHEDMLEYIRAEYPEVQAVGAGFFRKEADALWSGGQSDSLNLKSRPKDRRLLQAFFGSPDRRTWDLTMMTREAEAVAKTSRKRGGRGHGRVRDRRGTPRETL